MARRWKYCALVLGGLLLGTAVTLPEPCAATSWPPALVPLSDEDLLGLNLSRPGCVGIVEVLQRAPDSGPHGEYTEYLDVRPIRWFAGTCGIKKMRLYAAPTSAFGFLSTGHWEVGVRDTVIVFAYLDKNRAFVSQSPFTPWNGLAPATPERIQFLDANVPRMLKSQAIRPASQAPPDAGKH